MAPRIITDYSLWLGICCVAVCVRMVRSQTPTLYPSPTPTPVIKLPIEIFPLLGPKRGGTSVRISGEDFVYKKYLVTAVFFDDIRCTVTSLQWSNSTTNSTNRYGDSVMAIAVTPPVQDKYVGRPLNVTVQFRGPYNYSFNQTADDVFEFRGNPSISDIQPRNLIEVGGIMMNVTGDNLETIYKPKLQVTASLQDSAFATQQTYFGECDDGQGSYMRCYSPRMNFTYFTPHLRVKRQASEDLNVYMKVISEDFVSDDVDANVVPDPAFDTFDFRSVSPTNDPYLKLTGRDLDLSASLPDYRVMIGSTAANLSDGDLSEDLLTCRLPLEPEGAEVKGQYIGMFSVNVYLGKHNQVYHIGKVQYETGNIAIVPLVVVIGIPTILLIIILVCACAN